jgi:hypothetical protein
MPQNAGQRAQNVLQSAKLVLCTGVQHHPRSVSVAAGWLPLTLLAAAVCLRKYS